MQNTIPPYDRILGKYQGYSRSKMSSGQECNRFALKDPMTKCPKGLENGGLELAKKQMKRFDCSPLFIVGTEPVSSLEMTENAPFGEPPQEVSPRPVKLSERV